jgi:hypothetical protein
MATSGIEQVGEKESIMDKDELTAILGWMQAMYQGWRATNTAWLDLAND